MLEFELVTYSRAGYSNTVWHTLPYPVRRQLLKLFMYLTELGYQQNRVWSQKTG